MQTEETASPWPTSPPSVARGNISSAALFGAELLFWSLLHYSALSIPNRSQKVQCKCSPSLEAGSLPAYKALLWVSLSSSPYPAPDFPLCCEGSARSATSTGSMAGFSFSSPLVKESEQAGRVREAPLLSMRADARESSRNQMLHLHLGHHHPRSQRCSRTHHPNAVFFTLCITPPSKGKQLECLSV